MISGNRYIVVSADSGITYAEEVSQFIFKCLRKKRTDSLCYIYEDIQCQYESFFDEEERFAQFLNWYGKDTDYQNIFLMFLFTPDSQSHEKHTTYFDQQLWLRAGKIIGKFSLISNLYKNQISFWMQKGTGGLETLQSILGGMLREFESDFKAISRYVDDAERRTGQFKINLNNLQQFQNKEMITDVLDVKEKIVLTSDFGRSDIFLKRIEKAPDGHYEARMEIKTIVKKENGEIILAPKFIEIVVKTDYTDGGV